MSASGICRALLVICLALAASPIAHAEEYPTRTIKMIVPTGAGGITDILARLVGKHISEQLGQPVIIDNRTGAGGTIGTRAVAQADPDGYTLLMVFPSHAANPALYAKLPYDSEKDFAPISMVTKVSEILLVPNTSPAKSVKEFVELARKQPLRVRRCRQPGASRDRAFSQQGRREDDAHPLPQRTAGAAGGDVG